MWLRVSAVGLTCLASGCAFPWSSFHSGIAGDARTEIDSDAWYFVWGTDSATVDRVSMDQGVGAKDARNDGFTSDAGDLTDVRLADASGTDSVFVDRVTDTLASVDVVVADVSRPPSQL